MKLPVTVPWNPVLSRMPVSGQLYAISGGTWIPVPDGTTRADLPKYMTWDRPTVASDAPQMERWTVEGSKGNSNSSLDLTIVTITDKNPDEFFNHFWIVQTLQRLGGNPPDVLAVRYR